MDCPAAHRCLGHGKSTTGTVNSFRIPEIRQTERSDYGRVIHEMLETYQMTLYKSLVFKDVEEALPDILNCLEADKRKARKVKEVVAGGQIQSGYYQLPQLKEDVNRFILFKTGKKGSATLIYIEGELDADDLVTMLFMKKN